MTKTKNKYFIIFGVLLMALILILPFLTPLKSSANANISQGFLNEYNLPVGSKLNDVELKFDTEKEPYKPSKNLVNLALGFNNNFKADDVDYSVFKVSSDYSGRISGLMPLNLLAGQTVTFSMNILDYTSNFFFTIRYLDGSYRDLNFNSLGFSSKTVSLNKETSGLQFYIPDIEDVGAYVKFSSFQVELGDVATNYVPYYYAPAVNGVKLFTDSSGGYLGYKIFDDVITYGYFSGQKEIIFWANERLEDKGIFQSGWQMNSFKFNDFLETETSLLLYHDNYSLHYRDTVYIASLINKKNSGNWFDAGLKDIFGEDMTIATFGTGAIVALIGAIVIKKVIK